MMHSEYKWLDRIDSPDDLKKLSGSDLRQYCDELRQYIIEQCSSNPGHLASSLGAVELAVALHYVFNTPDDKIVWDVGHQTYAHKIITGRREAFRTNRKLGGISGFPRMSESPYDAFGGGNIFRGLQGARKGFDRVKGDQMGMLATIINSLALQSALEDNGVKAKVLTSIRMEPIGEYYSKAKALEYLEAGYVVIIGGGTSNPYFSTDSASALRGIELEADVMLKGTRVDGVYTADPEKDPAAEKFDEITFDEVYRRNLKVMDMTAFTLCRENGLRVIVFDMDTPGNLEKVLAGEKIGTLVKL